MLSTNDVAKVFETILSIPGMNETVKIDLRISRKNILLMNSIIQKGLPGKGSENTPDLLNNVADENIQELKNLMADCMHKAGLVELSEKLEKLNGK